MYKSVSRLDVRRLESAQKLTSLVDHYYTTYLGDSWRLQALSELSLIVSVYGYLLNHSIRLVYTLFTLDFAQTLLCTQFAWHYAVDIWNQPAELNGIIPWTAGVIPIVGGFGESSSAYSISLLLISACKHSLDDCSNILCMVSVLWIPCASCSLIVSLLGEFGP